MGISDPKRSQIFVSYSHQDVEWLKRLRVHLKPLEQRYGVNVWDDSRIESGSKWRKEIRKAIDSARAAVLLVSPDFIASDFIRTDEIPPLLAAAEGGGATILPLILSPCRYEQEETLSQFQSVNPPSRPLTGMTKHEQEEIFVKVASDIEKVFTASKRAGSAPTTQPVVLTERVRSANAIELANLIALYSIPDNASYTVLAWSTGAEPGSPIVWKTRGVIDGERIGEVIVTVNGEPTHHVLEENLAPGKWRVILSGPRAGISSIRISSNVNSQELDAGGYIARLTRNSFEILEDYREDEKLASFGVRHYKIRAPGKKEVWVDEEWSCGSSGCSVGFLIDHTR